MKNMFGAPIAHPKSGLPCWRPKALATRRPIYVRFGAWPTDERSSTFAGQRDWVFKEQGVSAYRATYDAESGSYYLTDDKAIVSPIARQGAAYSFSARLAYVITGREIGLGVSGEPLLRHVRVVGYAVAVKSFWHPYGIPRLVPISKAVWRALEAIRGNNPRLWITVDAL